MVAPAALTPVPHNVQSLALQVQQHVFFMWALTPVPHNAQSLALASWLLQHVTECRRAKERCDEAAKTRERCSDVMRPSICIKHVMIMRPRICVKHVMIMRSRICIKHVMIIA